MKNDQRYQANGEEIGMGYGLANDGIDHGWRKLDFLDRSHLRITFYERTTLTLRLVHVVAS